MRKPLFYATITKTFEHKKGGKDVYLSSEYLKQFDKDLYYKILLLESFEDQAWHTAAQLAQVVQLDARSVSKYLNELSKNYQQFSGKTHPLFTKNHRSGYNFYDTLDSIEHERFLIYLVQSTLKFQLLHDIFFEEFHTMYQFAQKHYISESTAHRKINEWKQQLQTYGIRLQRGTYIAQGEEEIIRLYLHMTFWQLFRGKIWPFETISQMDVKNMAEHIMAFFNVRLNEIKKRRLEYMLGAFFLRKSQKHYVVLNEKKRRLISDNLLFQRFCQVMEPVFPNYFQVEDELGALFLVLMTREEYYSDPKIRKKIFDFHQQAKTPPFTALSEAKAALSLYQEEQGLPAENLTFEAENYLFSSHFFAYLFPNAKETIDGNSSDFINHLVIENKELKQWLVHFFESRHKHPNHLAFKNHTFLMGRYLTVFKTLGAFTPQLPKITILLMTDFPLFEEQLLEEGLRTFFRNEYQLIFLPTDYRGREVDLLISTSKVHRKPWADLDYFIVTEELKLIDYIQLSQKFEMIQKQKLLKQ
ncbi:M protein trans-acting positive regulator [Enterococcus faecium EnGen0372]|uniref:helix-turn-helix domain-containing protein n=1 Tax=Enterococcus faecium TaxID=1352 RepID=UPI00032D8831|nr:helix-turn-helix domain-containing protein [Enterococcus faecium]AVJ44697.1 M protein trans-acting positive regulator [Enterococcus faecium]EME3565894.1 helix-turn-helix domain-containing protein [Enterococcus faecium]EOG06314.1 M protein trans-acting positive regulator [Enterococcus faecium EnGen0171]EOK14927.1 M protein trans-acting positive regulator [Enterococcus faecium EnGen0372]EOM42263.1 M protein trans-acting positive regulator [Enterococcus faecium EnGen0172]